MKVWDEIAQTLHGEFSDVTVASVTQLITRLLVACAMGGLLGYQREVSGKAAGFRTHILVALGAAAFVAVPLQAGIASADASRILQGLITGIGFLGAGCIIKQESDAHVKGMTTAAGIWLTAAVGVSAGMGREGSAVVLGLLGWFTLSMLYRWERRIAGSNHRANS